MALRARSRLLLLFGLGILVVFASLYLLRARVAEELLVYGLHDQGIDADLKVTALDLAYVRIEDLATADGALAAERVELTYQPLAVLEGRLDSVRVTGLTARLDLSEGAPALPGLEPSDEPSAPGDDFDLAGLILPTITLESARIEAETPLGPATILASGEAWSDPSGAHAGVLDFKVDGAATGFLAGSLTVALEDGAVVLGDIVVEDGRLALPAADLTGLRGHGSVQWTIGTDPSVDLQLNAATLDLLEGLLPQSAFRQARLAVALEAGALTLDLGFETADGSLTGEGRLEAGDVHAGGPLSGEIDLRVEAPTPLAAAFSLPEPDQGSLALDLAFQGEIPPLADVISEPAALAAELLSGAAVLSGSLRADALSIPGWLARAEARLAFEGTASERRLSINLPEPARIEVHGLDTALLAYLGVPGSLIAQLGPGLAATLEPIGDGQAVLESDPDDLALLVAARGLLSVESIDDGLEARAPVILTLARDGALAFGARGLEASLDEMALAPLEIHALRVTGDLSGDLTSVSGQLNLAGKADAHLTDGLSVQEVDFLVPLDLAVEDGRIAVSTGRAATVTIGALRGPASLTLSKPLRAVLEKFDATLTGGPDPRLKMDARLSVAPAAIGLRLGGDHNEIHTGNMNISAQVAGPISENPGLRGSFSAERVEAPAYEAALSGIAGDFTGSAGALTVRYSAEGLDHPLLSRAVPPLRLDGTAQVSGDTVDFETQVVWPGDLRPLSVTGRLRSDGASGSVLASLGALDFDPDGLQPQALSPLAEPFKQVDAELQAEARLAWDDGEMESGGLITLRGADFEIEDIAVSGANAEIRLSSLWPLSAPAGQQVTLSQVDLGLPASDIAAHFSLRPGERALPFLVLEDAGFQFLGSTVRVEPQDYDLYSETHRVLVTVSDLDLVRLFELLDIEGVSGTGRINGAIPVSIGPEGFSIEQSRLAAETGILRIASPAARELLSGGGEQVALLLEALEDFRYEVLELSIDKTAQQDLTAKLSILGANPEVLDGHPFQVNINLASNIENVMSALIEGYMVSSEALRRAWRLAQ